MKAHETIIRLLKAENVETIFALMSEDTMSLMSELETNWNDSIQLIKTRHEQGAVAMADGRSRMGNEVSVCFVGRGPAIAQTGTALVTARKKGSKILLIVPETPLSDDYDIKEFEQESYLQSTVGNVVSVRSHDTLVSDVKEAFRKVKMGDGPLAVQIPWDVLDGDMDAPDNLGTEIATDIGNTEPSDPRLHPDKKLVKEAVDLYLDSDTSHPPVILTGRGAIQADAKDAIEELAERTGALLATSLQGRGYFTDHPYYLGFAGGWGSDIANQYANESDIVFAVGCSLNPYTTDKGQVFGENTKVIHIDADARSIGRYTPVNIGIEGDARVTVEAISQELEQLDIDRQEELWTEQLRKRIAASSSMHDREYPEQPGTMDPRELILSLNELLPDDRTVVTDAGHFTRWVMDGIDTHPDDLVFTLDFASIGLGIPMGVGAALAYEDRPCITFCGDAGFMMSMQELETAVRNDVPLTIIVLNDSSLGSEYHSLEQDGLDPDVALISTPDFADVAQALGAEGHTVRSIDELNVLSERFGRQPDGPLVVDCKINHEVRHRSKT